MSYIMQAVSSVDGTLKTWTSSSADFAGAGFPGPGTAVNPVILGQTTVEGTIADNAVTAKKLDSKAAGFATYAEARAAILAGDVVAGDRVRIHGRTAMGDGGQGWFDCVNASATDNGGTLLTGTAGTATPHLKRDYLGEIFPEWWGAVGNGTTSDTAAVQSALDLAYATGDTVRLSGLYAVSNIAARGGYNIVGCGYSSGFVGLSGYGRVIAVNYGSGGTSNPANNEKNATWSNFVVRGRSVADGFSEHVHNIVLSAVTDFTLDRLWIEGNRGDGVYLGSGTTGGIERHNKNVTIRNCYIDGLNNSGRNGLSVIDVDGLLVQGCKFFRTSTSGMPGAIDLEPDDTFNIVRGVTIDDVEIDDVIGNVGCVSFVFSYAQSSYTVPPNGFTVSNVRFGPSITGPTLISALSSFDATTSWPSLGLVVSGCSGYDCNSRAWNFNGVRGVRTENNTFSQMDSVGLIGYDKTTIDVELGETDTFFQCGLVGSSGLGITKASYVRIWSNFVNCGQADGLFGYALDFSAGGVGSATSDNIDISRLRVSGARTLVAIQKEAGHTFTPATNNSVGAVLSASSFFQATYPGNQPWNMGKIRNVNSTWLTPSSGTTVDVSSADQVSFENYSSLTNVTDFTNGYDGQILLVKLSANAVLVHDVSKIILENGANAVGNSNNFVVLERRDSLWREVAPRSRRVFPTYTIPADGTTTPSVAGYDNVSFENYTTSTNVTNFTGGAQGQELKCRMDPQVTLVHGSGLALKGATNVSGRAQGDWISFRLYGGTWEETSRSW